MKDFLTAAFDKAGMDWQEFVSIDERYFRPTGVDILLGDPTKAREGRLVAQGRFRTLCR